MKTTFVEQYHGSQERGFWSTYYSAVEISKNINIRKTLSDQINIV